MKNLRGGDFVDNNNTNSRRIATTTTTPRDSESAADADPSGSCSSYEITKNADVLAGIY